MSQSRALISLRKSTSVKPVHVLTGWPPCNRSNTLQGKSYVLQQHPSTITKTLSLLVSHWTISFLWFSSTGSSARTVYVHLVTRGSEPMKWPCGWRTKSTTWSASSVQPVRSTSVSVTVTCSSTRTLCASRTSMNGPNLMGWCRLRWTHGTIQTTHYHTHNWHWVPEIHSSRIGHPSWSQLAGPQAGSSPVLD